MSFLVTFTFTLLIVGVVVPAAVISLFLEGSDFLGSGLVIVLKAGGFVVIRVVVDFFCCVVVDYFPYSPDLSLVFTF
jgi:hypothetical protein